MADLTDDERATIEAAATDAEQRYQEREREIRTNARNGTAQYPDELPIGRQPFAVAGTFRIYFNRHQAAPLVWSIALEDAAFEIAVAEVVITSTFDVRTVYRPKATPDDEDGKPSAWIEVSGVLRIDPNSSTARIG